MLVVIHFPWSVSGANEELAIAPISNVALAGSCSGGDHIHTDEQKKEKKLDA